MAGNKETPRQRMIGLVYLILTALLAIRVSDSVIKRFEYMNNLLTDYVNDIAKDNIDIIKEIEYAVNESGKREEDVAVLNQAKSVRGVTLKLISELDSLKNAMYEFADRNIKDDHSIERQMIQRGGAEGLKDKLNNYALYLTSVTGKEFEPIAIDPAEDPLLSNDNNQRRKSFEKFNFGGNTTTIEGMVTISQFQTEIISHETEALSYLAGQVGAKDIKFDRIVPMVVPESKYVVPGIRYKAEMFIAASSTGITPEMKVDGNDIPVDPLTGRGMVDFVVTSPGSYDANGLSRQTYQAYIKIPGADTPFVQEVEYMVARPAIQIQSASVQALYYNCGNDLNVLVPALGQSYNPTFSAEGADVIPGNKTGAVTLIPKSGQVKLNVSSNGNFIGSETFRVRPVPLPDIKVFSNGKELDLRKGVSSPGPRSIELRAIADPGFKEFLPNDARYRVNEWRVTLARGSRPVVSRKVEGPTANISDLAAQARSGDRIVIEVNTVQRRNFRDQTEEVRGLGTVIHTIPLN